MRLAAAFQNQRAPGDVIIDVIGVGAPKCGTSWLAKCLSEHPSVCMAEPSTLNYFCQAMIWPEFRAPNSLGADWLSERFARCRGDQKLVEVSPNYLYDEITPAQIFDHNPHAKLIFTFRHPVEMLNSFYYQLARESALPPTLDDFVSAYPEIRRIGLYYFHLRRFLDVFPREQCLFLLFDDITERPMDVLARAFSFLEISTDFRAPSLNRRFNVRRTPRSQSVITILNRLRHFLQEHTSKRLWDILVWKSKLYRLHEWILERNLKPAERLELDPRIRNSLLQYFREDTRALGTFLERDLSSWER